MSRPATSPAYMQEPWFAALQAACAHRRQRRVASMLGISTAQICQVLGGTGKYGKGAASTATLASKVLHAFCQFDCPYLSEESIDGPVQISADQCRQYACRPAPTSRPREMQHWMACQKCPHRQIAASISSAQLSPGTNTAARPIAIAVVAQSVNTTPAAQEI